MKRFYVEFYKKENGNCPMREFLESLDIKKRAKVLRMIHFLEENGNELREPYSKLLQEDIFELRIKLGTDIFRVLYFFCVDKMIILTHGFIKKTKKTPRNEIIRAIMYRKDYFRRNIHE